MTDIEAPYRAYLGGPMSGIPQFNFPAFFAAADHLRGQGWDIVSPAELDDAEDKGQALKSPDGNPVERVANQKMSGEKTWGDFLARDVKIIADQVQAIILLPGWADSRGAILESTVGLLCKHDFYLYDNLEGAVKVTREFIKTQLMNGKRL